MSKTRNIPNSVWDSVEYNPLSYNIKIGFYNRVDNCFCEVARFRNSYNKNSGANYGILQIWNSIFNCSFYEKQGGRNTCGGYNKPIANLESCLYQFSNFTDSFMNKELQGLKHSFNNCGSIDSLMNELRDVLQCLYNSPLFIINC